MSPELVPDRPITADGVRDASQRITGHAIRTPLIENEFLNEVAGGRVLIKAEVLQHCGSFKFRGAFNLVSQLTDYQKKRGVLAWSSGNHAQGLARAARLFKIPATIIMPADTPALKAENVKTFGADIIPYDRYSEDREEIAKAVQRDRNLVLAPPFDHPDVIEGQGTLALETVEDARARALEIDAFIICCGGGGLTSGCATILEDVSPQTDVWIAEPEDFDETWASIKTGERQYADIKKRTICDAIANNTPGRLTLPIMQRLVRGGVTITEDEVEHAIVFAYKYLKLIIEPGGAVALAAILSGKVDGGGKVTAITLSGGNIDPGLFAAILGRHGD